MDFFEILPILKRHAKIVQGHRPASATAWQRRHHNCGNVKNALSQIEKAQSLEEFPNCLG
jgi:hypothetical protein